MSHWSVYLMEATAAAVCVHSLRAWRGRRAWRRHCEWLREHRGLLAAKHAEGGREDVTGARA